MRWLILVLLSSVAFAQQQVTPEDFTANQTRLFKKVTEAVSTPCCQNGIPVAYHASGMAQQVRDDVIGFIRAGKSEREMMKALKAMRFGPEMDMELIFTVPDENLLGNLFWWIGVVLMVGLLGMAKLLLRKSSTVDHGEDDDVLVDKYRDYIGTQVRELG